MGIQDMVMNAVRGVLEKVVRNAIGYSICAICAVAVLILATSAGIVALIPAVGTVYALLIVAGVFLLVIAGTMLWLQYAGQTTSSAAPRAVPVGVAAEAATTKQSAQFAQIAMIIEAVMLGYSMSRKR